MKVYTLIETADVEIVNVRTFFHPEHANEVFDVVRSAEQLHEYLDLEHELPGTLRFAGDDSYAAQLFESDVQMAPHMVTE